MEEKRKNIICLKCKEARFIGPDEICYKSGGLYCRRYHIVVGKYDQCIGQNLAQSESQANNFSA